MKLQEIIQKKKADREPQRFNAQSAGKYLTSGLSLSLIFAVISCQLFSRTLFERTQDDIPVNIRSIDKIILIDSKAPKTVLYLRYSITVKKRVRRYQYAVFQSQRYHN